MIKHKNDGDCAKCKEVMNKFPDMNQYLRKWFMDFQKLNPEAHISCAGRGAAEQANAKDAGKSRAAFGESAHNYNCAIDIFVQDFKNYPNDIYPKKWFQEKIAGKIPYALKWYGEPGSAFFELPHIEVREWRGLKVTGEAKLVESPAETIA